MPEMVRNVLRLAAGAVVLTLLLVAAHRTASDPTEGAILRIALRTTAGTAEDCRRLSPAELEALPRHMRREEICETRAVPYRLDVHVGEKAMLGRTYTAWGIHGDRPLVVDEEIHVAAGTHRIRLRFVPETPEAPGAAAAPDFAFDSDVAFPEGRIRVVSLGAGGRAIEVR